MSVEDKIKQLVLSELGAYHDVNVKRDKNRAGVLYYFVTVDEYTGAIAARDIEPEAGGISTAVVYYCKTYKAYRGNGGANRE